MESDRALLVRKGLSSAVGPASTLPRSPPLARAPGATGARRAWTSSPGSMVLLVGLRRRDGSADASAEVASVLEQGDHGATRSSAGAPSRRTSSCPVSGADTASGGRSSSPRPSAARAWLRGDRKRPARLTEVLFCPVEWPGPDSGPDAGSGSWWWSMCLRDSCSEERLGVCDARARDHRSAADVCEIFSSGGGVACARMTASW
mmetsp:Transcript_27725/g.74613  ORF Transcript_27725/g.74613 Transcript_27725/m.74613 type:complete len:204 (-) Transcript_27725:1130-1741(-)